MDYLKSKLAKALFCIKKLCPPENVVNHLPFTLPLTSPILPTHRQLLIKIEHWKNIYHGKKAISSITNSKPHTQTEPIFSSLKILPYHKIIYKAQLTFFHSIHNKYAPTTFSSTWLLNSQRNPAYELRNADCYFVPPANFTFFERSPLHLLPKIWNSTGTITLYNNP